MGSIRVTGLGSSLFWGVNSSGEEKHITTKRNPQRIAGLSCLCGSVFSAIFSPKNSQDDGKGRLGLRGVAFTTVSAVLMVWAVLESTLPSFCLSGKKKNLMPGDGRDDFDGFGGCGGFGRDGYLTPDFPRAKLRRQIFMTRAEVWAKNWGENFCAFSCFICCAE